MVIRQEQIEAIRQAAKTEFQHKLIAFLRQHLPEKTAGMTREDLADQVCVSPFR